MATLGHRNGDLTKSAEYSQIAVMVTKDQIRDWEEAGEAIRRARKAREDHGKRSADEVKALREETARNACCCGDCFEPLSPNASVTRVGRFAGDPRQYNQADYDRRLAVPICLSCWLIDITDQAMLKSYLRGVPQDRNLNRASPLREGSDEEIRRLRCEGCARPMRVRVRQYRRVPLPERCCCTECHYKATLKRANERRRVRHEEQPCIVCGELFTPTQSTAKTCSGRCRAKLSRQRKKVAA